MKKIGVFGSAFNPLHLGHMIIAEQAIARLDLDFVFLVPTKNPYHKNVDMADFKNRFEMACLEADLNDKIKVSDLESRFDGNSYTYDLLNLLREDYPDDSLFFIMGSDSLVSFKTWYRYEDLIKLSNFIVFKRPEDEDLTGLVDSYRSKGMRIHYFDDLQIQISSSFVRKSIKEGKSVRYILSDRVISYIKENGLYE
ncbi:MAG: nicotinate (nicotinamide) nucleotide adenylyltransferase [Tissierellia bacterium]|nr:nicotinate (nicotinamide) nucleotide adenylyltransferase [Tissierellia bacterium]